jgi:hypothetical protein
VVGCCGFLRLDAAQPLRFIAPRRLLAQSMAKLFQPFRLTDIEMRYRIVVSPI